MLRLVLALLATATAASAAEVDVVPRPASVALGTGPGIHLGHGTVVHTGAEDDGAAQVAAELTTMLRFRTADTRGAGGDAILLRRGSVPGGDEAYQLTIADHRATITAATDAGLRYGAVTLWQLATAGELRPTGAADLPAVTIADAPRFAWRGLLLDSARHLQSPAFIRRTIDWMMWHKLNVLQWHLTDDQGWRLEIKAYPRLTAVGGFRTERDGRHYGGYYTQAQVRSLVAYAAARGVTIVPEIEMPGHALAAIRAYPQVGFAGVDAAAAGDWGVFPSIYRTDDATFTFLTTVLGEVLDLFPGRFIAIGGDEAVKTAWRTDPATQARMRAAGIRDETALQAAFVGRIGDYLNARGRRLIGWDEILDGDLPATDAVLSWHGADGALAAAKAGHDVVMATAPTLYFDHRQSSLPGEPPGRGTVVSLADLYAYDPGDPPLPPGSAKVALTAADRGHILGVQANLWTEHMASETDVERMALPRAAALAEAGWTAAPRRDWADFLTRLPAQLARYRRIGLDADDGAVAVEIRARRDGAAVEVRLADQVGFPIRYTTDGGEPVAASSLAAGPLAVPLGTTVLAASFASGRAVSPVAARTLDAATLSFRVSQQLQPCSDRVVLNLAGPGGPFLTDIMDACWRWPAADLDDIGGISVGVAALPFNFQLGDQASAVTLRLPTTAAGELVVHLDTCSGPVVATLPLSSVRPGAVTPLTAPLAAKGRHDLCLAMTARRPDPLHVLGWVRLDLAQ
jgi:hexosaminidase